MLSPFKTLLYSGQLHHWSKFIVQRAMATAIKEEAVTIGRQRIAYALVGHGPRRVLLLPGSLGSYKTDFQPQLAAFDREQFTLVAWDPPGYGRSRPLNRDFSGHFLRRDADYAHKLMQELNFGSQYSIVGWSGGAVTAMIVAAKYPRSIERLTVFGAAAFVTKNDVEIVGAVADVSKWSDRMKAPFLEMYGEEYFRKTWAEWFQAYKRFNTDYPHGSMCLEDLEHIQCPTLIIHGGQDSLVPKEHAFFLQKNIPDSELLLIPEGKHNFHLKFSAQVNSVVQHFLLEPMHPMPHEIPVPAVAMAESKLG